MHNLIASHQVVVSRCVTRDFFFFSLFSKKIKTYLEDLAEAISIPAISEGIALILNSEEFYHAHTYCNQ